MPLFRRSAKKTPPRVEASKESELYTFPGLGLSIRVSTKRLLLLLLLLLPAACCLLLVIRFLIIKNKTNSFLRGIHLLLLLLFSHLLSNRLRM